MSTISKTIDTVSQLEIVITNALRLQGKADKEWSRVAHACANELLYRKAHTMLDRATVLCAGSTIWRHMSRAICIMTGAATLVYQNGKPAWEYAETAGLLPPYSDKAGWDFRRMDAAKETDYLPLRKRYEEIWKTLGLSHIAAKDPEKSLAAASFRKAFERFAENESRWLPEDREAIKAILLALNGIGGIPRRADLEKTCAATTTRHDGSKAEPIIHGRRGGK